MHSNLIILPINSFILTAISLIACIVYMHFPLGYLGITFSIHISSFHILLTMSDIIHVHVDIYIITYSSSPCTYYLQLSFLLHFGYETNQFLFQS